MFLQRANMATQVSWSATSGRGTIRSERHPEEAGARSPRGSHQSISIWGPKELITEELDFSIQLFFATDLQARVRSDFPGNGPAYCLSAH
jgi:hypothetical protein